LDTQARGDVCLGQRPAKQIAKGQRDRPVHHPVHPQHPLIGRNLRHDQLGVDPVEAGVRGEERGDPRDRKPRPGGHRRCPGGRSRKPDCRAEPVDAETAQQGLPGPAARRGDAGRAGRDGKKPPPARLPRGMGFWRRRIVRSGRRAIGAFGHGPRQKRQRHCCRGDTGEHGYRVHRSGVRTGDRGGHAQHAEDGQPGQAVAEPAQRQHPGRDGERGEHHEDPGHQDLLVVAADVGDHEVLHRNRRQVDGDLAHRHHRAARRPDDPGYYLSDAQRGCGGDKSGHGTSQCPSRRGTARPVPGHALYSRRPG
jgi:hypothetical protein